MQPEKFAQVRDSVNQQWDSSIIKTLEDYIRIENQSPHYDPEWETNGLLQQAMDLIVKWVEEHKIEGTKIKHFPTGGGRTPFLFIDVPANGPVDKTILMYGHMDKQPPLLPWEDGLGPYLPVIRDGKLYGRGGADDGYSAFAAIASLTALRKAGLHHARVVITIEGCEESGSPDLPYYINLLKPDIGNPDLIICLDSGAVNYDQMWLTTSLRGIITATITTSVTYEGVHSGIAGGLVPSSVLILRQLLSRLEDEKTGEVLLKELHGPIPDHVIAEAQLLNELGDDVLTRDLPLNPGAKPFPGNAAELAIANSWKPSVAYIGIGGIPELEKAGNVLRKETSVRLAIRIPPSVDPPVAEAAIRAALERDPPYGAKVVVDIGQSGKGWAAPAMEPWLKESVNKASQSFFSKPFGVVGLGGSIPFMAMLGELFPAAQFVITGVLGPKSNAHGPNEFLHIDFSKGITGCVASIVHSHYEQYAGSK
eukprot:TRINITY_DN27570_c0_g1_i1.p1 TRINITY_DN27570_c0_g1~~TRINITY_DN27570_c0_g1_i1.p1  ORF type:complete len:480 (-),score=135.24 TRINITY_DN27570_c0_g1_i1:18-1457(-)